MSGDVGMLVRTARLRHGLTQEQLALRAGTRQATISRIESGREAPTVARLAQLLLAVGERLVVTAEPLGSDRDQHDAESDACLSMSERLERGMALAAFASELAGAARR